MNSRWATLVAAALVAFASLVITWQVRNHDVYLHLPKRVLQEEPYLSLAEIFLRGERLAEMTNIVTRSGEWVPVSGSFRYFDLVFPANARVFMTDMTGPTNYFKMPYYWYATYHLFPREIGVSVDQPTRPTKEGFVGRTSESNEEILANGYDVRVDLQSRQKLLWTAMRVFPLNQPANPDWFNSNSDTAVAFLLPLLTALAGMWLFRFLFFTLSGRMPLLEQLACGLGLGMMAVAALTLGIKLCGFHGRGLMLMVTAVGAIAEIWRDRKAYGIGMANGWRKMIHDPLAIAILTAGTSVFLILFRIAGLEGLVDRDAVMAWMLKAKIMHLYAGNELVHWFSAPRLAQAHLDYPTLVPSLHAATYDALGHVDEFVTKFWPAWMLFFLLAALASLNRGGHKWRHVPSFALLGLLLLPVIQEYVRMEGSTLPMIFFTVLGFVQCALWLTGPDRARLGLGLTFLFGGAMTHFEGFILLALAGGWILLLPSARPALKPSPPIWRLLGFWFLAVLPYVWLRVQIPSLHYQSDWAGYALQHPGITLSHWPGIFMILFVRMFVNPDFADWNGDTGHIHWIGKWDGLSSLYHPTTVGLAWFCLLLTVALWFAVPARRRVIVWILAMFIGATAVLSGVFTSFITVNGLSEVIGLTKNPNGGRYVLPVLLAWFATIMTAFFTARPSATPTLVPGTIAAGPPASASASSLPGLKDGCWLALGAILIMVLGVFVLPKKEPALPENPLPKAAAANPPDSSETNAPEDADVQARMAAARQMDKAGKFAEALQMYREAARLHPTNPMVLNKLAWNLAMNPVKELRNGKAAVQLASRAVELTDCQQPLSIMTLAAAYAEDGQLSKAVAVAQTALALAVLKDQPVEGMAISRLLEQLSAHKTIGVTNAP